MDNLQDLYRARFKDNDTYRARVWDVLVRDYFQRFVRPSDTVLDLGAGYGEFINHVSCAKKYAMDLNPDTAQHVNKDVEVLPQDCSAPWPLQEGSVDVVFTSNFFEHLPDKEALARTLKEARRSLKPGGLVIALGPNIKYLPGVYWDFWDHYVPLTEYSLGEALQQEGFSVVSSIDRFLPYTMVGKLQYPVFFVALYLRMPFAWRFFGRQFLVIASTPGKAQGE